MADTQILFNRKIFTLTRHQSLVGRSQRCSIVLTSRLASREHCLLECGNEGLTLIELGSRNGTWVNESRVFHRCALAPGDRIRVGTDHLRVVERREARLPNGRETQRMPTVAMADMHGCAPSETPGPASVIDLWAFLVETAGSPEQRPHTAQAVVAAVDELLDQAGFSRPYLTDEEARKLASIVDQVLAWWPDASMKAWRHSLEGRIRAAERPATGAF